MFRNGINKSEITYTQKSSGWTLEEAMCNANISGCSARSVMKTQRVWITFCLKAAHLWTILLNHRGLKRPSSNEVDVNQDEWVLNSLVIM